MREIGIAPDQPSLWAHLHRMRDDLTAKVRSRGDAPDEATSPEIGPGAHMVNPLADVKP